MHDASLADAPDNGRRTDGLARTPNFWVSDDLGFPLR
jgi:hypothetical protein